MEEVAVKNFSAQGVEKGVAQLTKQFGHRKITFSNLGW